MPPHLIAITQELSRSNRSRASGQNMTVLDQSAAKTTQNCVTCCTLPQLLAQLVRERLEEEV